MQYKSFLLLISCLILTSCTSPTWWESPSIRQQGKVVKVSDGDTVHIQIGEKREKVRLLLIDTPEVNHPNKSPQPFGKDASQFTKRLLLGKTVDIELDKEEKDKYGRTLAYLYLNSKSVQELLIEKGLARVVIYAPNDKYAKKYQEIEAYAKKKKRGIWSIEGYVTQHGYDPSKKQVKTKSKSTLPYDPKGPDRDCRDFKNQQEAQTFFLATGPDDPHRLDPDRDGIACESLR